MTAAEIATEATWDLDVFVAGHPAPKGSTTAFAVRSNNKRGMRAVTVADNRPAQREWVAYVQDTVRRAWTAGPTTAAVHVEVDFVQPRRASAPKRSTPAHTRKPDGDKLTRCVWDALTHIVWTDDAQVVAWSGSKREAEIGETPGARIRVRVLA